jgi:hypothetical protein
MLNQTKMKKIKRKSSLPALGGMTNHFGKKFQRQNGQGISTSNP